MAITVTEWSTRLIAMADALSVPDGGFTVDPRDGSDVRHGYAVSVHPEHERVITGPVSAGDLIDYIAHAAECLALPGRVLGGWRDPRSGHAFLDVSVVSDTLSDALMLARASNQLAVFDFASMRSMPVTVAA
jgi:hypothetical protein